MSGAPSENFRFDLRTAAERSGLPLEDLLAGVKALRAGNPKGLEHYLIPGKPVTPKNILVTDEAVEVFAGHGTMRAAEAAA